MKDENAGKSCRCPHCSHVAPVPALVVEATVAAAQAAANTPNHVATSNAINTPQLATPPRLPIPPVHDAPKVPGYEILGELGRGGMGVVYKARQVGLKRIVALKMILAGAHAGETELNRFRSEAAAAASLQHPNIVQIHEIGSQNGQPYFSLEFVEGGSLDKKVAGTPQPPHEAAALVETLARAMAVAHQRGIIHRDLKPANILLAVNRDPKESADTTLPSGSRLTGSPLSDCIPKITDFGLAKQLEEEGMQQTRSGAIMGTPSYMAPEQAAGHIEEISPPTDVYALGAILYEMLTGRPPFRGQTPLDTMFQVMTEDPVPPTRLLPKVPLDLETICLKCLQKERGKRYAGATELADDLRRFLNGEPILARPVTGWERTLIWARRRPAAAALVAVSVAASVLFLALWTVSYVRISREQRQTALALKDRTQALDALQVEQRKTAEALDRETRAKDELLKALVQNARLTSEALTEFNSLYASEVVERVRKHGIEITHDYAGKDKAIPLPATMSVELGKRIGLRETGMQVRLYSDYPFPWRKAEGGPKDEFEREALRVLRSRPDQPYYRFENWQGKPSLRYVTSSRMKASCVNCHNTHPNSPKKDWKEGEVRGAFEVIFPVNPVVAGSK